MLEGDLADREEQCPTAPADGFPHVEVPLYALTRVLFAHFRC